MRYKISISSSKQLFVLLATVLIFAQCGTGNYSEFIDVGRHELSNQDGVEVPVTIEETGNFVMHLELRHTTMIPYATIPLNISVQGPGNFSQEQELNFRVRNEEGYLEGSAMGDLVDTKQLAISNIQISESGLYKVKVKALTKKPVSNVLEVGAIFKLAEK
jgi:hypothetical protein